MEQEIKVSNREIIEKLARLQADIEYIKSHMKLDKDSEEDKELQLEMRTWEEASEKDNANFFEKYNL